MKIHVLRTGEVHVSPYLPFGGDDCSMLKASGMTTPSSKWIWLPVNAYLIEHPKGKILVDTGWHREMSPKGEYDVWAQIKSLGTPMLYKINQGRIPMGEAIDEQLAKLNIRPSDLDYVLLTHLDCDHASGLRHVRDAKHILVSRADMEFTKHGLTNWIRYTKRWWKGVDLQVFDWNGTEGPAHQSYDVLGDGSVVMINIPGHSDGLCCVRIRNEEGKYIILAGDGGYARKSWREMITSGVCADKQAQRKSLQWLHDEDLKPECIDIIATHDTEIEPQVIEF